MDKDYGFGGWGIVILIALFFLLFAGRGFGGSAVCHIRSPRSRWTEPACVGERPAAHTRWDGVHHGEALRCHTASRHRYAGHGAYQARAGAGGSRATSISDHPRPLHRIG